MRRLSHINEHGQWVTLPELVPELLALCHCAIQYMPERRLLMLMRFEPGTGRTHSVHISPEELITYDAWVFVIQNLIRQDYGTVAQDQASP